MITYTFYFCCAPFSRKMVNYEEVPSRQKFECPNFAIADFGYGVPDGLKLFHSMSLFHEFSTFLWPPFIFLPNLTPTNEAKINRINSRLPLFYCEVYIHDYRIINPFRPGLAIQYFSFSPGRTALLAAEKKKFFSKIHISLIIKN